MSSVSYYVYIYIIIAILYGYNKCVHSIFIIIKKNKKIKLRTQVIAFSNISDTPCMFIINKHDIITIILNLWQQRITCYTLLIHPTLRV